jgi:hypothetical protein
MQELGINPSQSLSDQNLLDIDLPDPELGHPSAVAVGIKHLDVQMESIPNQLSEAGCGLGSIGLVRFWSINASQPDAFVIDADGISIRDVDSTALQAGNQQQDRNERWAEVDEQSDHC